MKKYLLSCIIVIFLATICSASAQQEPRGFDGPYECANALFKALSKLDVTAIEDCYAIPEMAQMVDFRKYCERLNSLSPIYLFVPSNTQIGIEYNESSIRISLYRRLILSSMYLVDREYGEQLVSGKTFAPLDDNVYAIISLMETPSSYEGFGLLTLEGIVAPDVYNNLAELYYSERNTKNRAIQTSYWTVEDEMSLIIVANEPSLSDGDKILIPVRFVQVNGRWLADPMGSNLGNIMGISSYIFTFLSDIE